jgi:hypothetical protein
MADQIGDPPELESERAYVVYDGQTGVIVHVHRTMTLAGGERRPEQQDAEQAIELARRFGHRHEDLRTLAVTPEEAELPTPHRVDPDGLRLIPDRPAEAS